MLWAEVGGRGVRGIVVGPPPIAGTTFEPAECFSVLHYDDYDGNELPAQFVLWGQSLWFRLIIRRQNGKAVTTLHLLPISVLF